MSKEKSIIIIDGGNFYHKLKSLSFHQLLSFNFQAFCSSLARSTDLISCTYYVGEVKTTGTEKSQKMYDAQQRLLGHLKKSRLRYTFGYLLKDGDGVYHEKGVDVHMAVNILVATYENL